MIWLCKGKILIFFCICHIFYFRCGSAVPDKESPIAKLTQRKVKRRLPKNRRVADLDEINLVERDEINGELMVAVREFCLSMLNDDAYNKLTQMTRDIVIFFIILFFYLLNLRHLQVAVH